MAISYVSHILGSGVDSMTVNRPTGVQDEDFLVGFFEGSVNVGWPVQTGWTQLYATGTNSYGRMSIQYRKAQSEPSTYTWTKQGICHGGIIACRGVDTVNPINVHSLVTGLTCPDVTTTVDNCLILRWTMEAVGDGVFGFPAEVTELWDQWVGWAYSAYMQGLGTESKAVAGAVGTRVVSCNAWWSNIVWTQAATIALAPLADTARQRVVAG